LLTCVFIDFENIEKTVREAFGSVLDFDQFIGVVKDTASEGDRHAVGMYAHGDFDRGDAGLQTRLLRLGIEPRHVVTKSQHQYFKGTADIELSLDILQTMYDYPHIGDFLLLSGDGDLAHVVRRLRLHGKEVRLMGFEDHTSRHIRDVVDDFVCLDQFPRIMRKLSDSEREKRAKTLLSHSIVAQVIRHLDYCERELKKDFIGLNYFRKRLLDRHPPVEISDALTAAIENGIIELYPVPNPDDAEHPTTACKLSREHEVTRKALARNTRAAIAEAMAPAAEA
jgi:uncharacterized LabA/DUF88 family protein